MTAMLNEALASEDDRGSVQIDLPLHPAAAMTRDLLQMPWEPVVETRPSGFLLVLDEHCEPAVAYRDGVKSGDVQPGAQAYASPFDFD
jgi:hypothetical protein